MKVRHVALTCRSLARAGRFYQQFLGLKKISEKTLPAPLSQALFNLDVEFTIVTFANEAIQLEIFISDQNTQPQPPAHVCLEVSDLPELLQRAEKMKLTIKQIEYQGKKLIFLSDEDGNLWEIKPAV